MTPEPQFAITDHALVRWLDRVHGIDMEWLRDALAAQIEDTFTPGIKRIKQDKIVYVFDENALVTVIDRTKDR